MVYIKRENKKQIKNNNKNLIYLKNGGKKSPLLKNCQISVNHILKHGQMNGECKSLRKIFFTKCKANNFCLNFKL